MVENYSDRTKKFALLGAGVLAVGTLAALVYRGMKGQSSSKADDQTSVDADSTTKQDSQREE